MAHDLRSLEGKNVVLAVTGSIAAYKIANLASLLVKRGANVLVAMTDAAARFISPLTFEALTKHHPVCGSSAEALLAAEGLAGIADAVVLAPASADAISHVAKGLPSDVAVSAVLSASCPVAVAPAMNVNMYENVATQANLELLAERGLRIVAPASGMLACGDVGQGKLAPEGLLLEHIEMMCARAKDLAGKRILVTAGPTRESLDPVRFITNHSTGRMGYAIARQAMLRGADVVLVTGRVSLEPPAFVEVVQIESAQDMFDAVTSRAASCDAVIKAAAVADYRPAVMHEDKVKKKDGDMAIALERTQDILAWLGAHRVPGQRLCGFSMETRDVLENSRAKLERKNVDMICANSLKEAGAGFGTPTNRLTLITREGVEDLPLMSKEAAADKLLDVLFAIPCEEGEGSACC